MKSRFLLFSALALCSATVAAGNYPTSLYVIGDATPAQWDSNNVIRMVTVEDGVYEYTGDLTEGRMRFVTTYDFVPGYGPAMASTVVGDNDNETYLDLTTGSHELEYRSDYTAPDKSFKVSASTISRLESNPLTLLGLIVPSRTASKPMEVRPKEISFLSNVMETSGL